MGRLRARAGHAASHRRADQPDVDHPATAERALQASGFRAASAGEQTARLLYLLERLEQQVSDLAGRIEQLERTVGRDDE
ncbi:MAG: hypothetical protein AB1716_25960 [Planctomycetota bacterium]